MVAVAEISTWKTTKSKKKHRELTIVAVVVVCVNRYNSKLDDDDDGVNHHYTDDSSPMIMKHGVESLVSDADSGDRFRHRLRCWDGRDS
jgi:hypothetical protein